MTPAFSRLDYLIGAIIDDGDYPQSVLGARSELAQLRATVAALTAERDAAYRRGWCDAREAAAVCASGVWRLRNESGEYNEINLDCVSDTIREIDEPTEHDTVMLEAWHERM